jgi:N-acetylglutamate synthase
MGDRGRIRELEEVALLAWPALEEEYLGNWRLRCSDGYTKRANSVQPFMGPGGPLRKRIEVCEAWYAVRGQPCIFRLSALSQPDLAAELDARGYRHVEQTSVLTRSLDPRADRCEGRLQLRSADLDEWLSVSARMHGWEGLGPPPRGRILRNGAGLRNLGLLEPTGGGEPVAAGIAVVIGSWLGLFDLVTAPGHRRRGHGTELVERLLGWGIDRGARGAYLQVVRTRREALGLYAKLGFDPTFEYGYRVEGR